MKVIKAGCRLNYFRFKCEYCDSELEARSDELSCFAGGASANVFMFYCPVCQQQRLIDGMRMETVANNES